MNRIATTVDMPTTAATPIKKVIKIVFKIVINSSLLNSIDESSGS